MITTEFVLAGRSIFTIEVPEDFRQKHPEYNPHYTFRVNVKEATGTFPETRFVGLLTGPNNESDYSYVGILKDGMPPCLKLTAKSKYTPDSVPVKLFNRVIAAIWQHREAEIERAGFDVHHEGRCGKCGRMLTDPESIKSGIGPVCAEQMMATA